MHPRKRPSRVIIDRVLPEIDNGRYPIKRAVGEEVEVEAHVFADGHDVLSVTLLDWHDGAKARRHTPMTLRWNDEWLASFTAEDLGVHRYTVHAQIDRYGSWRRDTRTKIAAGQDVSSEMLAGAQLLEAYAHRLKGANAKRATEAAATLRRTDTGARAAILEDDALAAMLSEVTDPDSSVTYDGELRVTVDPPLSGFSAWYELFPRSAGTVPGKHGTFDDVIQHLDRVASMGFDILYLPPVHPIGTAFRKGKNNTLTPLPDDVGSPWAIGGPEGGHKAVHPDLGTLDDFDRLVAEAGRRDIAVALDIAFQCSPDHPYVKDHPEWFKHRPDGTIQYAENPPKKYQDIYPFDFECKEWKELWDELKSIFDFWIGHGVKVFRVDNPHTKAFPFWEWCIPAIKGEHPDVIFLAEAFTRPKMMSRLARLGYTQSYTYFTWRNAKTELQEYLTELTQTDMVEFFRPNFWPNTPDILHEYLQTGGRPAFIARLVLAATLSSNYGMYGPAFELLQNVPVARGSEEYLDSEKYQVRAWDVDRPQDNITSVVTQINAIRRAHAALHSNRTLRFHPVDNPELIAYSKRDEASGDTILVVVNLDPHYKQSGFVDVNLSAIGVQPDVTYEVEDLLNGASYLWSGSRNYLELDPASIPAHVFNVRPRTQTEHDFPTYA